MKQYFGFMDETGVLSNDPQQRFFALGLLKIAQTSTLFEKIKRLKDRYGISSGFEFKFTGIKRNSHLALHKELVDICFAHPNFYFAGIVVDKNSENHATPESTWEMQLQMAKRHIRSSVKADEQVAVIADYLTKPNSSLKYFEDELQRVRKVFNACMIESDASVFVQVVDIFIGCIVYRYKINHGLDASISTPKGKLVEYIEGKLEEAYAAHGQFSGTFKRRKDLQGTFTIFEPFYFSVYSKR